MAGRTASAGHRLAPWLLGFVAYWVTYAGAFRLSVPQTPWSDALRGAAFTIWPEALLAPAVLALTRRVPWDARRGRSLLLHLAGGLAFMALSLAAMEVSFAAERWLVEGKWALDMPAQIVVWRGVMTLLVYCALCSIGHAAAFARRVRAEAERAARAETLRAEARLAALRAQLNPHFILNLLHSLMGLVARDPTQAAAGLERLGDLLRHTLRVQRQEGDRVRLRDELDFVADYLALERLRLGDRLRVQVISDPERLDSPVPAFVLQPLVENAVRHAVAPRAEGGRLRITVRSLDGGLRLSVEDDGPGPGAPPTAGEGLGLRLIRERLAALYGERAWLRAGAAPGGGFAVEVAIPAPGADDEAET